MNYTVYKALNNLANGTATFNSTINGVRTAITAVDANYPLSTTQEVLSAIAGGCDGWNNNLTTLGGTSWATASAAAKNYTPIAFTQTAQWQNLNANIQIPASGSKSGSVSVKSGGTK